MFYQSMGNEQSVQIPLATVEVVQSRSTTVETFANTVNPPVNPPINWNVIQGHRWSDEQYNSALAYLKSNTIPIGYSRQQLDRFKKVVRSYSVINDKLVIIDNHIPRWLVQNTRALSSYNGNLPIIYKVVKQKNIKDVLYSYMQDPLTTGLSRDSLYDKVVRDFLLGIGKKDVSAFLKESDIAQKLRTTFKAPIVKSYRPNFPMEHWQIDLIDMSRKDLVDANLDYSWILVVIDIFSKFVYLYPLTGKFANNVSTAMSRLFLSGDIPKILQNDNGNEFQHEFIALLNEFNIEHIINAGYNPQTNGFVENKNKQIKMMIHSYMTSRKTLKYVDILDRIAFNINSTKHKVTKMTPFQVHRGVEITYTPLTIDEKFKTDKQVPSSNTDWKRIYGKSTKGKQRTIEYVDYDDNTEPLWPTDEQINTHVNTSQSTRALRVSSIKDVIDKTADKREISRTFNDQNIVLNEGNQVRIAQKQYNQSGKSIIKLQLRNEAGVVRFEYGKNIIAKPHFFEKKMIAQVYPDIFVVEKKVHHEHQTPYLILYTLKRISGTTEKLYAFQYRPKAGTTDRIKDGDFDERFFRSQLYLIRNAAREFIAPPDKGYYFREPDNPLPYMTTNVPNAPERDDRSITEFELAVNGQEIRKSTKMNKTQMKTIFPSLKHNAFLKKHKIYVEYTLVAPTAKESFTYRGFLKTFHPKNVEIKINGIEFNNDSKKPSPFDTWRIDFSEIGDTRSYFLPLNQSLFSLMRSVSGWKFSDDDAMLQIKLK
jgi:transposase InsO family protein